MLFVIGILFLIVCIVLHELAHWYEMERHGMRVVEAGLGIPIPYLTLKFTVMRRGYPVVLKFSPFLLGAYVKPSGEDGGLEYKCYRCVADIAGAGPIAHFVIAFVLAATLPIVAMACGLTLTTKTPFGAFGLTSLAWTGIWLALAAVTWRFRSFISAYILPFVGLASLVLLASIFLQEPEKLAAPENGGPVAIGRMVHSYSQDLIHALTLAISMNVGLGMINAMPLGPTDGGQIFEAAVQRRLPRFAAAFSVIGTILILGLLVLALVNDVRSFF